MRAYPPQAMNEYSKMGICRQYLTFEVADKLTLEMLAKEQEMLDRVYASVLSVPEP
jgi:hypothetical protein